MARPRKHSGEARDQQLKLRLTMAEAEHLRAQAERAGLSAAEYARRRILGHVVTPRAPAADAALVSELNRIGVNVNQLARVANADPEFIRGWEYTLSELRQALAKVTAAHGS